MTPSISICSLIYRSPSFADAVYQSLHKHTAQLHTGVAEFYFVANDPTRQLVEHLQQKKYPHYVNLNARKTSSELFALGYAQPEYIHYVYKGWNYAIKQAKGEIVVLVNSDMMFSPHWLDNLINKVTARSFVVSQLIEPQQPYNTRFPTAIHGEFGKTPKDFNEAQFLHFCTQRSKAGYYNGGAYMPCAFRKQVALDIGLYPEGNIAGKTFYDINESGDAHFVRKLKQVGIEHITATDSIVYHFHEGEMHD